MATRAPQDGQGMWSEPVTALTRSGILYKNHRLCEVRICCGRLSAPSRERNDAPMTSLRTPAAAAAVAFAVAAAAPAAALAKPATVTISGATGSAPLVGLLARQ